MTHGYLLFTVRGSTYSVFLFVWFTNCLFVFTYFTCVSCAFYILFTGSLSCYLLLVLCCVGLRVVFKVIQVSLNVCLPVAIFSWVYARVTSMCLATYFSSFAYRTKRVSMHTPSLFKTRLKPLFKTPQHKHLFNATPHIVSILMEWLWSYTICFFFECSIKLPGRMLFSGSSSVYLYDLVCFTLLRTKTFKGSNVRAYFHVHR